jgi:hypothetical protein
VSEIPKIVALLAEDALEKRIAAAIVLGEIGARQASVVNALAGLLESGDAVLQRHALGALAKLGAARVLPRLFPLLASGDGEVRAAAASAIASAGAEALPEIRSRMTAADPVTRRALDGILASLGGKDAFGALLEAIGAGDAQEANAAALAMRQRVRQAGPAERKVYLAQTQRFLEAQRKKGADARAVAAAVKILGYLEDARATETLLAWAADEKAPAAVRREAVIALRFAGASPGPLASRLAAVLLDAARAEDALLAQAALMTLGGLRLSADHEKKLLRLVDHPELERSRFVIERLGAQRDADAGRLLAGIVARTADRRRAELAARALEGNGAAAQPLARALLEVEDADRAWLAAGVLRGIAEHVSAAARTQLLESAMARLEAGDAGWEAPLAVARQADPAAASDALRKLAEKLRKSKAAGKAERAVAVLSVLCHGDGAEDEDRYRLAAMSLASPGARRGTRAWDEALASLERLSDRGFEVAAALRRDRAVAPEVLYQAGFQLAERGHALGAEILRDVAERGGRTKVARMAKNKLKLIGAALT